MGIKSYKATKDNTITNGFQLDRSTRATGSNMGASDILEVYSIYGQQTTSSAELSRVLVEFPIDQVSADRTLGDIPEKGNVNFYLRLFNARHSEQLPRDYTVNVLAVSQSWQEGYGLDMDGYTDVTDNSIEGSTWNNRSSNPVATWHQIGGDYHSSSYIAGTTMPNYTFNFKNGDEDLFVDVTDAVEEWIAGTQSNNGFGIFLTSSFEAHTTGSDIHVLSNPSGQKKSFYTKRFFSRSSEFFFKRPSLEARWDSRIMDDRGNFYSSASIASADDNLNKLYLYNYIRGTLKDIPHNETIKINLYASLNNTPIGSSLASATAGKYQTGIYSASISLKTTSSIVHDVWSGSIGGEYKTGSIKVKSLTDSCVLLANDYTQFSTKITNLKTSYGESEIARFRVFSRPRNFSPTIYSVASKDIEHVVFSSASFEIYRSVDNKTIIQNSTGSDTRHTYLSYDDSGGYFDLDMSLLEPDYMYGIRLHYHSSDDWREQQETFEFRVEKR